LAPQSILSHQHGSSKAGRKKKSIEKFTLPGWEDKEAKAGEKGANLSIIRKRERAPINVREP